jgi:hypothetical protein
MFHTRLITARAENLNKKILEKIINPKVHAVAQSVDLRAASEAKIEAAGL